MKRKDFSIQNNCHMQVKPNYSNARRTRHEQPLTSMSARSPLQFLNLCVLSHTKLVAFICKYLTSPTRFQPCECKNQVFDSSESFAHCRQLINGSDRQKYITSTRGYTGGHIVPFSKILLKI